MKARADSGGYGSTGCRVLKRGGTKLEIFIPKNQHAQRKLLNFENWFSVELSKIGHHFSNNVIQKKMLSKKYS